MHNKTVSELKKVIEKKEVSALELTNHFLDRIKNLDSNLNSFITLTEEQAIDKARSNGFEDLSEAVLISDAFFPFVDGVEELVSAGVTAIIQPCGSINDKKIIKFANETNTVLLFSKTRHFRH